MRMAKLEDIQKKERERSELEGTYSKELPELAYQTIPSPENVAQSIQELLSPLTR